MASIKVTFFLPPSVSWLSCKSLQLREAVPGMLYESANGPVLTAPHSSGAFYHGSKGTTRPLLRINPHLKRFKYIPEMKQQVAYSFKQKCNFCFLEVSIYLALLFSCQTFAFFQEFSLSSLLSLGINVHVTSIYLIWDSACMSCAVSVSPSCDP